MTEISPRNIAIIAAILIISASVAGYVSYSYPPGGTSPTQSSASSSTNSASSPSRSTLTTSTCPPVTPANGVKLNVTTFDGVTRYALPQPLRSPGAVTVAPDGSVWFGEQGVPGVGHLSPNGTLREYPWNLPLNPAVGACGEATDIYGVALWNGTVWAADQFYDRLVSVNPTTGAVHVVQLASQDEAYTLTVGPDNGSLWFTILNYPAQLGRLLANSSTPQLFRIPFPNTTSASPIYVSFKNSTVGYVLVISPVTFMTQIYQFDPSASSPTFAPIGGPEGLLEAPTSMALANGGIWVTEHGGSAMAFLNFTTSQWTLYPLSTVPITEVDLSYFDVSNGTNVWFTEHYANRLGEISDNGTRLTEWSDSNPPASNETSIDNAISLAQGDGRVWFAGWTGNYVAYLNTSYVPPYSVSVQGPDSVRLAVGASTTIELQISGQASGLNMNYSDTEGPLAIPQNLTFGESGFSPNLNGRANVTVTLTATQNLKPGNYVAAITVADQGMIYRSVYVHVTVT